MQRTTYTTLNSTYIVEEREEGTFVKRVSNTDRPLSPQIDGAFTEGRVSAYGSGLWIAFEGGPIITSAVVDTVVEEVEE